MRVCTGPSIELSSSRRCKSDQRGTSLRPGQRTLERTLDARASHVAPKLGAAMHVGGRLQIFDRRLSGGFELSGPTRALEDSLGPRGAHRRPGHSAQGDGRAVDATLLDAEQHGRPSDGEITVAAAGLDEGVARGPVLSRDPHLF